MRQSRRSGDSSARRSGATFMASVLLTLLAAAPALVLAQSDPSNPFAAPAKAEPPKASAPAVPANPFEAPKSESPKSETPKAETPKAESPAAEAPAAAEAPPPTAPGQKSVNEYRSLIQRESVMKNWDKVLSLCDEAEKTYPGDATAQIVGYYRTNALQRKKEIETRANRAYQSLQDRSPKLDESAAPPAAATPAPEKAPAPRQTPASVATPVAAAPSAPAPAAETSGGKGKYVLVALMMLVAGGLGAGAFFVRRRKGATSGGFTERRGGGAERRGSRPANAGSDSSYLDGGYAPHDPGASDFGFGSRPVAPMVDLHGGPQQAQPQAFGLSPSHIPSAAHDFKLPDEPRGSEDDIFAMSPPAAAPKPAPPKPHPTPLKPAPPPDATHDSDIFGMGADTRPAPPKAAPAPKEREADLFALFDDALGGGPETKSRPSPPASSGDTAPPFSFDTPKTPTRTSAKAAADQAPWGAGEEIDSIPALPLDTLAPPPAAAAPSAGVPWDTDSKTKTAPKAPAAAPRPASGADESSSLPMLEVPGTPSPQTWNVAPTPNLFGSAGALNLDLGGPQATPPAKAKPAYAEMSLKGIRSPETSETIGDLDLIRLASDTNPGLEVPSSVGEPAAVAPEPPPIKLPTAGDITLPAFELGTPPEGQFDQTMKMTSRELSEDPDLMLSPGFAAPPPPKPAPPKADEGLLRLDKLKTFGADETVMVDLSDSMPPPSSAASAPAKGGEGDTFDQEREVGMQAFRNAEWEKAVYHLSIAAALRPEAADIKEHLRRARRMRKEH